MINVEYQVQTIKFKKNYLRPKVAYLEGLYSIKITRIQDIENLTHGHLSYCKFLSLTLFRGLKAAILTEKLQKAGYDLNYCSESRYCSQREESPDDIDQ
jgi:hypothetical protein